MYLYVRIKFIIIVALSNLSSLAPVSSRFPVNPIYSHILCNSTMSFLTTSFCLFGSPLSSSYLKL